MDTALPPRKPKAGTAKEAVPAPAPPTTKELETRKGYNPTLLKARFPADLTNPTAMAEFLNVAYATGLNPFMMEIVPIAGRIYITEMGWQRLIDQRAPGQLVLDECRLADADEYKAFGDPDGWLAVATIHRFMPETGQTRVVHDFGLLTARVHAASKVQPVKDEPWRQAMKTARVRALRKAFPEVLYKAVDSDDLRNIEILPEDFAQLGPGESDKEARARFMKRARNIPRDEYADIFGRGNPGVEEDLRQVLTVAALMKWAQENERTWEGLNEDIDAFNDDVHGEAPDPDGLGVDGDLS